MLFSSVLFLWVFLPAVLIINYLLGIIPFKKKARKIRAKNIFLLLASLLFYAWGGIYYLLLILSSILLNYLGAYIVEKKMHTSKSKRTAFITVIALNIAILFFFKYFNMMICIIESFLEIEQGVGIVLGNALNLRGTGKLGIGEIVLPIGISFFTFQSMSYVIDVYRKKAKLQKNIVDFALYVSLFPQLIAGPIVKYNDVAEQLENRRETLYLQVSGQKRFCYGLAKKVLLSNTFAQVADSIWALEVSTLGTPVAWLGIVSYTLQIYYDFSGYSDMAIGIGRMLGFQFKENFDYPYTALSIQDFWRRWHISLSSWFKEYVYIPLGGNRKGKLRTYFNLFIVFLLTGVWHGANFTFIVWGLMYAVLLILERLFLGKWLQKNPVKIINWLYTMLFVIIGWVFFRSDNISQALSYLGQMFSFRDFGHNSVLTYLSMMFIVMFAVGILCFGVLQRLLKKYYEKVKHRVPVLITDYLLQIAVLILSVLTLVGGTYNPFIYFQF